MEGSATKGKVHWTRFLNRVQFYQDKRKLHKQKIADSEEKKLQEERKNWRYSTPAKYLRYTNELNNDYIENSDLHKRKFNVRTHNFNMLAEMYEFL